MRNKTIFDMPTGQLARRYNIAAGPDRVQIPARHHELFVDLYERVEKFAASVRSVIYDSGHIRLTDLGRSYYHLPEPNFLRPDLHELARRLHDFDPYERPEPRARIVLASRKQIDGFFACFAKAADMAHQINEAWQTTEYPLYLRVLKETGEPYQGPSCLMEKSDIQLALNRVHACHKAYLDSRPR